MRFLLSIAAVFLFAVQLNAAPAQEHVPAAAADTTDFSAFGAKLDEYYLAMEMLPAAEKMAEVDFIISSCTDPKLRQYAALRTYAYYISSKLMGDEAVAIHITDEWLATGKVEMLGDLDLLNAKVFAEFNRSSLIGCRAPVLELEDSLRRQVTILDGSSRRYALLYFYDTSCSRCKLETPLLRKTVTEYGWPLDFYAVYTGQSEEAWNAYVKANFQDIPGIVNLWDPDAASDFQRKYGVLQTPKIFLLDRNRTVVGRGLDSESLIKLLKAEFPLRDYAYGSDGSEELFSRVFGSTDRDLVMEVMDAIAGRTMEKGDTTSFKRMAGDLLYWLPSRKYMHSQKAEEAFIDKYILDRPDIWTDPWDSSSVVGFAQIEKSLLSRTPEGSRLPAMKVPGTLHDGKGGEKTKVQKLSRLENSYLIFYLDGCPSCRQQLETARESGVRVFSVNVDKIPEEKLRTGLQDTFDLSVMPLVLEIGKKGTIITKYTDINGKR